MTTNVEVGFTHYGTWVSVPTELANKPTELLPNYWKAILPPMNEVFDSHPTTSELEPAETLRNVSKTHARQ